MDTNTNELYKGRFYSPKSLYITVMPRKGAVSPEIFSSDLPSRWRPLYEDNIEVMTSRPNTTEKDDPVEFFEEMKPMIYVMKVFGLFPFHVYKTEKGVKFRRSYVAMLYSIVFYVAMNVYAYFVGYKRIQFIQTCASKFDDLMFSLVLFIYLLPHVYLLPTHWKEAGKVASFLNRWNEYQVLYRKVTGRKLILSCAGSFRIRNIAYLFAIILPLFALSFSLAEHVLILGLPDLELPFYWYILAVIKLHAAWWWLTCAAQRSALRTLSAALFEEPIRQVEEYRQLWLRLSSLCRQTGNFMFDTYGHLSVLSFTAVTMTLYGALSDTGQYTRHLGLSICVLVFLVIIFIVSDSAHRTWSEVGPDFCQKLCFLSPADKTARKELKLFILTVALNPPKINLGGYVDIDRAFMVKFIATMVTYLLVLLQFRLGVLSLGGTAAATSAPTVIPSSP